MHPFHEPTQSRQLYLYRETHDWSGDLRGYTDVWTSTDQKQELLCNRSSLSCRSTAPLATTISPAPPPHLPPPQHVPGAYCPSDGAGADRGTSLSGTRVPPPHARHTHPRPLERHTPRAHPRQGRHRPRVLGRHHRVRQGRKGRGVELGPVAPAGRAPATRTVGSGRRRRRRGRGRSGGRRFGGCGRLGRCYRPLLRLPSGKRVRLRGRVARPFQLCHLTTARGTTTAAGREPGQHGWGAAGWHRKK